MARQQTSQASQASYLRKAAKHRYPLKGPSQDSETPASVGNGAAVLDERQRREMIATAAFLRAQRRGFESGAELEDWLAAEEEIDRWLRVVDRGSEEPPLFEE